MPGQHVQSTRMCWRAAQNTGTSATYTSALHMLLLMGFRVEVSCTFGGRGGRIGSNGLCLCVHCQEQWTATTSTTTTCNLQFVFCILHAHNHGLPSTYPSSNNAPSHPLLPCVQQQASCCPAVLVTRAARPPSSWRATWHDSHALVTTINTSQAGSGSW